jgi:ABC-type Fe3+/spermidine/putrescine transport system ATPase subunit
MTLSDRVAIMHRGVIDAIGTPHRLFTRPPTKFVARFFGGHNVLPARLLGPATEVRARLECVGAAIETPSGGQLADDAPVGLAVPAQAISLGGAMANVLSLQAEVRETLYIGGAVQATCDVPDVGTVIANLTVEEGIGIEVGSTVTLRVDLEECTAVIDSEAGVDSS